jgi:hypothetical protein
VVQRAKYQTLGIEEDDGSDEAEEGAASTAATSEGAGPGSAEPEAAASPAAGAAGPAASGLWPSPRMNAMMAVAGSVVYLYGGTVEVDERQVRVFTQSYWVFPLLFPKNFF